MGCPAVMYDNAARDDSGNPRLQQNASGVLKQVQRGAAIATTHRGRPIAWLVPAGNVEPSLASLEASERLATAAGDLPELGPPAGVSRTAEPAPRRLAGMRELRERRSQHDDAWPE